MSASSSINPPPKMPTCLTCKIPLHHKKDEDGNIIRRFLRKVGDEDIFTHIFKCGRCGAECPPNMTWEEKMWEAEMERRRWEEAKRVLQNIDPKVEMICPHCGHNKASYKTLTNNRGEDWYVYKCCKCSETWKD
ncbi:uncharacterized protein LOC116011257 [Ipomoea triloba]|uniref:uncharacterized protein LOC116011257 n=1 Tax=Ipomoea triloba TaxID=35885 RepID=UPI00125D9C82|nr:uncharacterized protein LOC116011257 [Ipomoea triloba]XP_031106667.1 uncharacterized protein LOC116011257 [Ipomoea triloba]XP_031106668.1 uncharacterized protein LOC116011257 [Ipomoea triloba]